MEPKERIEKAFDLASDLVKQVLILSTGVVTVTATAARFIFTDVPEGAVDLMIWSWFAFLISVIFGVMGLMSLTGNMAPKDICSSSPLPSTYNRGSRVMIGGQLIAFTAGVLLVVLYAATAYSCKSADAPWVCKILL